MKVLARFAPPNASSVRRTGLRNAFLGLVTMVFGVMIVLSLDRLAHGAILDPLAPKPSKLKAVSGVPVVIGFVAIVVGLYRAISGVHPDRDRQTSIVVRLLSMTAIAAALLAATAAAILRARALAP